MLANGYIISEYGFFERRIARLVSITLFFATFLFYKGFKDKTILYVFVLLILTDLFGIDYEEPIVAKVVPIIKIGAYFLLARRVFSKIKLNKIRRPLITVFGLLLVLNMVLVYEVVVNNNNATNDSFESVLLFLYGVIIIGMCVIAVNYNFNNNSKRSLFFVYFIFALVFSDMTWYIAYYMGHKLAFFLDVVFYLAALFFMVNYALEPEGKENELLF